MASNKPQLSETEKAHAEYLSDLTGAWKHDKRKKQQTTHVQPEKPSNAPESNIEPEESLSDSTVSIYDAYKQAISNEWRTPSIIEDRRRLRKQKYNEMGQEAGSEEITEEDEEKAEPLKNPSVTVTKIMWRI